MKTSFTRTHISTATVKTYFSSGNFYLFIFFFINHREKAVIDENTV